MVAFTRSLPSEDRANCHAYYAADPGQKAWGVVRWDAKSAAPNFLQGDLVDDLNGTVKVRFGEQTCKLEIAKGDLPGDGTVPELSGQAPKPFIKQIVRHEGEQKGHYSYDHQGSYSNDFTTGLALYSIVKLTLGSGILNEVDSE